MDKELDSTLADALKASEEAVKELSSGTALNVIDLYFPYNNFFSKAAKCAMSVKVKKLRNTDKLSVTHTTALTCSVTYPTVGCVAVGEEAVWKAAKAVCKVVNELSRFGYVRGFIAPLTAVKLATEPHELEKWIVASFPMVSSEGQKLLEEDREFGELLCPEGGLPRACVVAD